MHWTLYQAYEMKKKLLEKAQCATSPVGDHRHCGNQRITKINLRRVPHFATVHRSDPVHLGMVQETLMGD